MKPDAIEALRQFIIATRHDRRLSQETVARRGGIPRGTLSAIEAGRSSIPRQETLQGIAKGLGVPYEALDRIARGLSVVPMEATRPPDEDPYGIFERIDTLPLSEPHRRVIKRAVRILIEDLAAAEAASS